MHLYWLVVVIINNKYYIFFYSLYITVQIISWVQLTVTRRSHNTYNMHNIVRIYYSSEKIRDRKDKRILNRDHRLYGKKLFSYHLFFYLGPSKCSIQCEDLGDGSAGVTYTPSAPGDYVIHILCDGEDIPKSPYVATIDTEMEFDITKVKAFGPGLSPGVQQDKQVEFSVDCKAATAKPESDPKVTVEIHNENYEPIPVTIKSNKNGTVTCSYKPKDDGKYTVCVNYNGCAVPDSPFKVLMIFIWAQMNFINSKHYDFGKGKTSLSWYLEVSLVGKKGFE